MGYTVHSWNFEMTHFAGMYVGCSIRCYHLDSLKINTLVGENTLHNSGQSRCCLGLDDVDHIKQEGFKMPQLGNAMTSYGHIVVHGGAGPSID